MEMQKLETRDYVIQANAISQAIYSISTNARRLIAMAMSLIPLDDPEKLKPEDFEVSFSPVEFFKSLGIKDGTKQRFKLFMALDDCFHCIIKIKTKNKYEAFSWVNSTSAEGENIFSVDDDGRVDKISMTINYKLVKAIGELKKQFSKIDLFDLGKLQSRYSIRIYEYCLSFQGFEGKEGNPPKTWFTPKQTLPDLRQFFGVENKYKETQAFIRNIINFPIKEINEADMGIRIEPVITRRGKRIINIYFQCKRVSRNEPRIINPTQEELSEVEKDNKLIKANQEMYDKFVKEFLEQQTLDLEINNKTLKFSPESEAHFYAVSELQKMTKNKKKIGF